MSSTAILRRDQITQPEDVTTALRQLVLLADAVYAEQVAKAQAESDARYQAEFGHNGPSLAGALGSPGRAYNYHRRVLSDLLGLPELPVSLNGSTPTGGES